MRCHDRWVLDIRVPRSQHARSRQGPKAQYRMKMAIGTPLRSDEEGSASLLAPGGLGPPSGAAISPMCARVAGLDSTTLTVARGWASSADVARGLGVMSARTATLYFITSRRDIRSGYLPHLPSLVTRSSTASLTTSLTMDTGGQ